MDKKELRQYIRTEKKKYGKAELVRLSHEISQILLSHSRIKDSRTVLIYHALPDEVDCQEVINVLYSSGKKVLLPKVISDTEMTLHPYLGESSLRMDGSFGIFEPDTPAFTDYSSIDMMIIPGMAFDRVGHRLGRGKGYYDRFLSRVPYNIYKIGVCFPFQLVENVPSEATDVMMDEVIMLSSNTQKQDARQVR